MPFLGLVATNVPAISGESTQVSYAIRLRVGNDT